MSDNKIASKLLEIENKDLNVTANFIGIKKDDDSSLTFTPDRVAQEVLKTDKEVVSYEGGRGGWLTNNVEANKNIFDSLGYVPTTKEVYNPQGGEIGEIVSKIKSEKSGKTWCYVKFENGQGVYNYEKLKDAKDKLYKIVFNKSRQEIRIGRLVRSLLSANGINNVSDSEIEKFVNDFKGTLKVINDAFSNFEIVEGDDLGFWYHRKNYLHPHKGSLGSSCQAVGRLDWLEIYIKNPETVKLLILKSDENPDKIVGRALVWNLVDGKKMMDRIYVSNDSDVKIFKDYAKHMEWDAIDDGNNYNNTYVAQLKETGMEKFPSVDTMDKWNPDTGKISNQSFPESTYIEWSEDDDYEDDYDHNAGYDDDD
jgi:hypothetical protein